MKEVPTALRALIVDDLDTDAELVVRHLRHGGFDVSWRRVDSAEAMAHALDEPWDIVISDYRMPRFGGPQALALFKARNLDLPFLIVSGTVGEEVAVDALRNGAHDFLPKDNLTRLVPAVERELREAESRREQRSMREQLMVSERMASVGLLAAGVAHEINNPLAALMANLEFIMQDLGRLAADIRANADSEERVPGWVGMRLLELDDPLRDARETAERVRLIVRDLKIFSRSGDEDHRGPVDVARMLDSSLRMAWNEIRHRAQLVKEYAPVPLVEGNESRLGQVFLNLVVNASQAIPEGAADRNEIRVKAWARDGQVIVEVRDTGSGIAPEVLPKIFDPFFTTKPPGVGTGLGLAITHRIIAGLGGSISVESQVGKGSVFRVALPASASSATTGVPEAPSAIPGRAGRILVIDDEEGLVRATARMLSSEHRVESTSRAADALAWVAAGERYDAILCDLMMPTLSGMDLFEELSRVAPEQAARMVFMTGGAFTERARAFLERVQNPRLEKPFSIQNLRLIIRSVLASDPARPSRT